MHPSHLSCPSSSASAFASTYVQRYVHAALGAAGFAKSSGQAADVLAEVFERYLLLLGSTAQQYANHVGRNTPCPWDAEQALSQLGTSSEDIREWLQEDGIDLAGRHYLEGEEEGVEGEQGASTSALTFRAYGDAKATANEDQGLSQLERYTRHGKVQRDEIVSIPLFFEDVSDEQIQELRNLFSNDEEMQVQSEGGQSHDEAPSALNQPQTPPPPYPGPPEDGNSVSQQRRKRNTRSVSPDSIVPCFLPALPKVDVTAQPNAALIVLDDAEYRKEIDARRHKGEERSNLHTGTLSEGPSDIKAPPEELATLPKRATEDLWRRSVPFHSSSLAASQKADDIPSIDGSGLDASPFALARTSASEGSTSSIRAFANDYPVLVQEARTSAPSFLTPSGAAHSRAFHQRRNVASFLTDPNKYVPSDTLFGSTSARPTALPFAPSASMLITPPTAGNSAPTFTPLRPHGRDLPCSTVQNNALYPACRHRIPGNVLNAARYVSGGVGTETFRRMTRVHDPEPILDDQHAERVFHGQPAPKELLSEGNSILKGALDTLKMKQMEERAASRQAAGGSLADGGEGDMGEEGGGVDENGKPTGQLSMSATRDRVKVKSGTVVSTWDWQTREYTDQVLPGKRFRQGTPGVLLGGPASAARGRNATGDTPMTDG